MVKATKTTKIAATRNKKAVGLGFVGNRAHRSGWAHITRHILNGPRWMWTWPLFFGLS